MVCISIEMCHNTHGQFFQISRCGMPLIAVPGGSSGVIPPPRSMEDLSRWGPALGLSGHATKAAAGSSSAGRSAPATFSLRCEGWPFVTLADV